VINRVVLCTGGFDPLHSGHIEYLKAAKALGNVLIVGVNSDAWLIRKKGWAFMPGPERVAIIENLKFVDHCILFNDDDDTAVEAIHNAKVLYPNSQIIFANGGDRTADNIPEMTVEDVVFEFGIGGEDKKNSSSWILQNWTKSKLVRITLSNRDESSHYEIDFKLRNTDISRKWLIELDEFIKSKQNVDDDERFYNFPYSKYTKSFVIEELKKIIDTINSYSSGLIDIILKEDITQDTLNYLHHIFEIYHGLYDEQQSNKFFNNAPIEVQLALRNLNILVHRYESLGAIPRFVATWYGKPSRKPLAEKDFEEFTLLETWGTMYINYCEVGKTLFDLYNDNDNYIDPKAFKPLQYYSMDFTVRFTDKNRNYYQELEEKVWRYYNDNEEFFINQRYFKYDPKLSLGLIPVADIVLTDSKEQTLDLIGKHQKIKSISIV
jgi:cytidyltransferase-like protein